MIAISICDFLLHVRVLEMRKWYTPSCDVSCSISTIISSEQGPLATQLHPPHCSVMMAADAILIVTLGKVNFTSLPLHRLSAWAAITDSHTCTHVEILACPPPPKHTHIHTEQPWLLSSPSITPLIAANSLKQMERLCKGERGELPSYQPSAT